MNDSRPNGLTGISAVVQSGPLHRNCSLTAADEYEIAAKEGETPTARETPRRVVELLSRPVVGVLPDCSAGHALGHSRSSFNGQAGYTAAHRKATSVVHTHTATTTALPWSHATVRPLELHSIHLN